MSFKASLAAEAVVIIDSLLVQSGHLTPYISFATVF
jgi:hypothetical protein